MYRIKIFIICLVYFFTVMTCIAEEYNQIDFETAFEIAQKNNLSKIDISIAKNDIKIANRLQNPSFQTFWNFGEAGKGNPNQIGLSETIELFKRNPRKNFAKSKYKLASDNYEYDKFNLRMDVAEAYIKLIVSKFILQKYEKQQKYLEDLLKIANRNSSKNDKNGTDLDVIQSRIALNEINTTVNKAKSETKIARIEFNRIINSKDSNYDVLDVDIKNIDKVLKLNLPLSAQSLPEFEKISETALKSR